MAKRRLYSIGSLIESTPLYPNLSARENLRVRTTLLGLPDSRIAEVLRIVGLEVLDQSASASSRWA